MFLSTLQAMAEFTGRQYLGNTLPYLEAPTPNIKISPLYNPQLNYEFYLEPYMVPAILHLLLCCCVAFAVGQEIKRHTFNHWINGQNLWSALLSKIWSMSQFSVSGPGSGCCGWWSFVAGLLLVHYG